MIAGASRARLVRAGGRDRRVDWLRCSTAARTTRRGRCGRCGWLIAWRGWHRRCRIGRTGAPLLKTNAQQPERENNTDCCRIDQTGANANDLEDGWCERLDLGPGVRAAKELAILIFQSAARIADLPVEGLTVEAEEALCHRAKAAGADPAGPPRGGLVCTQHHRAGVGLLLQFGVELTHQFVLIGSRQPAAQNLIHRVIDLACHAGLLAHPFTTTSRLAQAVRLARL